MGGSQLVPEPTVFVLFGATGDLAHRLVLPALFSLAQQGLLPSDWRLLGNGRGDVSHEDFQARVKESLTEFGPHPDEGPWEEFRSRLRFAGGGFTTVNPGSLTSLLEQAEQELGGSPQRVFYMAVPPSGFGPLTEAIGAHKITARARVVYEKPFGTSLATFEDLDAAVHQVFEEKNVFRIDHFLGKEATQDIHVLRFANGLFASAWDKEHIDSVQIDVPETLDVGMRANFYDATGAVLDMLVTHLFQVAGEVAMEPPPSLTPDDIAIAREEVISCFRPLRREEVVSGQYAGYREIPGIPANSNTETFVAARLWVDNERWSGVPFYLRTGKCLAKGCQKVSVIFKDPPWDLGGLPVGGNVLSFELSGEGEIDLSLIAKRPGPEMTLTSGKATLPLGKAFPVPGLPAYARLIHDVLMGDRSLFTRPDGLEHVWKVAAELLDDKPEPVIYAKGSWGPAEADALISPRSWLACDL